ncbi:MAG: glutamyl-tRNA reductase [Cognaticolwellia sp.]|jgi:glutamyl-tRNA reductase
MIGQLELVSVGLNHHTAPVELRERLSISPERLGEHFSGLRETAGTVESLILSTCNRVEVYALVPSAREQGIGNYLARAHGLRPPALEKHLYTRQGPEAVGHLFRVASSLDSLVLGEPQILGQVKQAFAQASAHGALGRVMQPLLRRTLSVAKRVRSETRIGRDSVSVGSAGVELARSLFGDLSERRVLLIGAGEMGRLVCQSLLSKGVEELLVSTRTYTNAVSLAQDFGSTAIPIEQLDSYLERVDIAVVSTSARHHLLTRARMLPILKKRRYRPLLLIDLSVPRNVAPDVHELDGAFLYNVDDLSELSREGLEKRQFAAKQAEVLVAQEALRCYRSLGARTADPVIASLTHSAEAARLAELQRSAQLLEQLTPDQRQVIDAMTRAMFKRYLHNAIGRARTLAEVGDTEGLRVLQESFSSEDEHE